MAKNPRVVQVDKRGQVVIPKGVRESLGIEESTAFWMYETDDGILLKKIEDAPSLKRVKTK